MPVPDTVGPWYISIGGGYAVGSQGLINVDGPRAGHYSGFGALDGPGHFGIAAGRRLWGNWRADIDLTFRPRQKFSRKESAAFNVNGGAVEAEQLNVSDGAGNTLATRSWDVSTYNVNQSENTEMGDQSVMFNLYYDVPTGTRFTPYIGGGLGLVLRQTKRESRQTGSCLFTTQTYTNPFTGLVETRPRPACTGPQNVEGGGSKHDFRFGVAAAAMAGLAYEFTPGVMLDFGYRFIWQDAAVSLPVTGPVGPESILKIDDRIDHELRASVRIFLD